MEVLSATYLLSPLKSKRKRDGESHDRGLANCGGREGGDSS